MVLGSINLALVQACPNQPWVAIACLQSPHAHYGRSKCEANVMFSLMNWAELFCLSLESPAEWVHLLHLVPGEEKASSMMVLLVDGLRVPATAVGLHWWRLWRHDIWIWQVLERGKSALELIQRDRVRHVGMQPGKPQRHPRRPSAGFHRTIQNTLTLTQHIMKGMHWMHSFIS